ncbi:uncharacterized protein LOC115923010 [Strongylocentrotus purpuratus]|uniref:Uncharacterized protein n=1 Tax=Strongylocentrotus purpuratus TaxID=7668 RepID=A0A7M7SXM7_STRPU|nr:uncharacterized protein LOC115923010 [Strongylocentrotus purpuratus]
MTVVNIRRKPTEQPNKLPEGNLHPGPETRTAPEQVNHAYLELQAGNLQTFPPSPPKQLHSHTLPNAGSHSFANSANTAPSAVAYTNQRVVDQSVRMATASHNDDEYDYVVLPE